MYQRPALSLAEAQAMVGTILEAAQGDGLGPVSIAIVDDRGDLLAFARMDGARAHTMNLAINKAYTAARAGRTTEEFAKRIIEGPMEVGWYGDPRYTGLPGGLPLQHNNQIVGGIGISGRLGHQDRALAELGLQELARQGSAPA